VKLCVPSPENKDGDEPPVKKAKKSKKSSKKGSKKASKKAKKSKKTLVVLDVSTERFHLRSLTRFDLLFSHSFLFGQSFSAIPFPFSFQQEKLNWNTAVSFPLPSGTQIMMAA
jgi:hypothetical protein